MPRSQAVLIFTIDLMMRHRRGELLLDDRDFDRLTQALESIAEAARREGGDMERAGLCRDT